MGSSLGIQVHQKAFANGSQYYARHVTPNNSFKPNPLRSGNGVAG